MKMLRLLGTLLFLSASLFPICFPVPKGMIAPGIDFPQDRYPLFEALYGGYAPLEGLAATDATLWATDMFGVHEVLASASEITFGAKHDMIGEPLSLFAYQEYLFVSTVMDGTTLFREQDKDLEPVQRLSNAWDSAFWANSAFVVFSDSDWPVPFYPKKLKPYAWAGDLLETRDIITLPGRPHLFGLGSSRYFYFGDRTSSATGTISALDLEDGYGSGGPNSLIVPLVGMEGTAWLGTVKGELLYLIWRQGDLTRFSMYSLSADPLHPSLLGTVDVPIAYYERIILNDQRPLALLTDEESHYCIVDMQVPGAMTAGPMIEDPEFESKLTRGAYFSGSKLVSRAADEVLHFLEHDGTASPPLVERSEWEIPRFIYADAKAIYNDQFTEVFLGDRQMYTYHLEPSADGDGMTLQGVADLSACVGAVLDSLTSPSYITHRLFRLPGGYLLWLDRRLLLFDAAGNCTTLEMPWWDVAPNLTDYGPEVHIQGDRLFLVMPLNGIQIYDISDFLNPRLVKEIAREDLLDLYPVGDHLVVMRTGEPISYPNPGFLNYEIWDLSAAEPMQKDDIELPTSYWGSISGYWAYFYIKTTQIPPSDFLIPFHITAGGTWEQAGPVPFPRVHLSEYPPFDLDQPYWDSVNLCTLDARDPGRLRLADMIGYPNRLFESYASETALVYQAPQGYVVMDPCGSDRPSELPFGWVDSPIQWSTNAGPTMEVSGWAVDADGEGVTSIELHIDGALTAETVTGMDRPDVSEAKPGYPDAATSGFSASIVLAGFPAGPHRLWVLARDGANNTGVIGIADFIVP